MKIIREDWVSQVPCAEHTISIYVEQVADGWDNWFRIDTGRWRPGATVATREAAEATAEKAGREALDRQNRLKPRQ